MPIILKIGTMAQCFLSSQQLPGKNLKEFHNHISSPVTLQVTSLSLSNEMNKMGEFQLLTSFINKRKTSPKSLKNPKYPLKSMNLKAINSKIRTYTLLHFKHKTQNNLLLPLMSETTTNQRMKKNHKQKNNTFTLLQPQKLS